MDAYHVICATDHVDLLNNHIAEILSFFVSSERECDLDKHCGVLDPDRKKVCTRLLTCNVSSQHTQLHQGDDLPQVLMSIQFYFLISPFFFCVLIFSFPIFSV